MERYDIEVIENATKTVNIMPETPLDKVVADCMKDYLEMRKEEEQGLLLRLPCKVGTTVYSIDRQIWIDEKGCKDCVYYGVDGYCDYEEEYPACTKVFETKFNFNMRDDFDKTVFLTKEQAEKALTDIKGGTEND